jgi:hypothetical protein
VVTNGGSGGGGVNAGAGVIRELQSQESTEGNAGLALRIWLGRKQAAAAKKLRQLCAQASRDARSCMKTLSNAYNKQVSCAARCQGCRHEAHKHISKQMPHLPPKPAHLVHAHGVCARR